MLKLKFQDTEFLNGKTSSKSYRLGIEFLSKKRKESQIRVLSDSKVKWIT